MNNRSFLLLCTLASALTVAGCGEPAQQATADPQTAGPDPSEAALPTDHPSLPQRQDDVIAPVDPSAGTGDSGMNWTAPADWVAETPANSMRRAQYRVPGSAGDGECVVFYFGPGQGGDAMSNAVRWANQFIQPDGSPSAERLKTEQVAMGSVQVLKAEVSGTYKTGGPMMGGSGQSLPDHMLLGAVAQGADANWFFKLTGPRETVEANRVAFDA